MIETFVEKVKLDVPDACVCKLLKVVFNKPSFCQKLTTLGFRRRIIKVKLLMFGVNVLLDSNTKTLIITELRN